MKIVLVDDQTLYRKGLLSLLSMQGSMEVVGEATNMKEALLLLQQEKPDLTIVNFQLGKESGLDVITEARLLGCTCKFAILTHSKDPVCFELAKTIDVHGYISLKAHPEELMYALHVIAKGRKYYDPEIIERLVVAAALPKVDNRHVEQLTSKEKEVLQKLGMGFTNRQISESLFITENTVKKHVSQVLAKLNLGDRTQAALYANETGLAKYKYDLLA